jgi:hypothetical protein
VRPYFCDSDYRKPTAGSITGIRTARDPDGWDLFDARSIGLEKRTRRWAGGAGLSDRPRGFLQNMRSVWICSRNDAVGNAAVLLAAMGVFGTGTGWPDVIVAAIMGGLGLWGGWQIVNQARVELWSERATPVTIAAE